MDVKLTRDEPLAAALDLLAWLTRPRLPSLQTEGGRAQVAGQAKDHGRTAPGGEWTMIAALEEPPDIEAGAELRDTGTRSVNQSLLTFVDQFQTDPLPNVRVNDKGIPHGGDDYDGAGELQRDAPISSW